MVMKWQTKLWAVAGSLIAIAGASNAQLINGDFSGGVAPWTAGGFGTVAGNGWIRNDAFSISGNYYWLNDGAGPAVGVSQLMSVTAPAQITITGQYASRVLNGGGANPSRNSFIIRILDAGGTNNVLYQQAFGTTALGNWTNFSVVTSLISVPSVRVQVVAQGNGFDDDYMIDNFTAASTPEPGTMALLGLIALPGVMLLRRRK
jgi:hypothetical protein